MRASIVLVLVGLVGCAAPPPGGPTTLQQAARNYPPLIVGSNTTAVTGPVSPRACPATGSRVEQKGGPTFEYLGSAPGQPALCRIRVGGDVVEGWYGIWLTVWPGVEQAYPALTRIMQNGTGAVEGFDVDMSPGPQFHDLIRNEGLERINLLGRDYDALKISHYREGFNGNSYRSVATVWKDMASGMLIYATYQHIAGRPVIDDPLVPTAIVPAPTGS